MKGGTKGQKRKSVSTDELTKLQLKTLFTPDEAAA